VMGEGGQIIYVTNYPGIYFDSWDYCPGP
jgi:hypothetical protein